MITFRDCITIYLACQAKDNLFMCNNCPCNTIDFRDNDDRLTDICNSLTSLENNFNSRNNSGE